MINRNDVFDVVIIGAGPAGIVLARQLGKKKKKVCLIEAGGKSEALGDIEIESTKIKIRSSSREHVFGGASSIWGGVVKELDQKDFCYDDHQWPISYDELKSYYDKAFEEYPIPKSELGAQHIKDSVFFKLKKFESIEFAADIEPVNFGKSYYVELMQMPEVSIRLNSIVKKLNINPANNRVESVLIVSSIGQNTYSKVFGKRFVVACGGIENARLLLDSKFEDIYGYDCPLGCYFMDHPKGTLAEFKVGKKLRGSNYYWGVVKNEKSQFFGLRLNNVKRGEPRPYIRLFPKYSWSGNLNIKKAILFIRKNHIFKKYILKIVKNKVLLDESEADVDFSLENTKGSLFVFLLELTKYCIYRVLPLEPRIVAVGVRVVVESLPNRLNRVTLSEKKDKYGRSLPKVEYSLCKHDRLAIKNLLSEFGRAIEHSGVGSLKILYSSGEEESLLVDASHHCGTTRMGSDIRDSVVDKNCKFHSIANLYAAGSSVFPVSGVANPTLTILALSIRLSEHLSDMEENE